MKAQSLFFAALFAAVSSFSFSAYAADVDTTPVARAPATQTKVKPHSHVEEKLGVSPKVADTAASDTADKPKVANASTDKSKHYHPRDGK